MYFSEFDPRGCFVEMDLVVMVVVVSVVVVIVVLVDLFLGCEAVHRGLVEDLSEHSSNHYYY